MKKVKVLVPFHSRATGKFQIPDDVIEVTDEQLADIRKVNVNMVLVLDENETVPKEKKPKEKKPKEKKEPE